MCTKTQRRIVYIDGEPEMIGLLRLVLENEQIVIETALNGYQGLELIRRLKPDVVLLDLMLSDLDGCRVIEEIRRDHALKDIPIIVVTALKEDWVGSKWPDVKQLAGYLTKPFAIREVRETVGRVLDIAPC